MDKSVTVKGKTYTARFMSLFQLQKCIALGQRFAQAEKKWLETLDDDKIEAEYQTAWLKYCAGFFDGDVSGLDMRVIEPADAKALNDFFYDVVASTTPKSNASGESSPDSKVT